MSPAFGLENAYLAGFFLGLSLILAIGAQNAFVLRQGLKGERVFAVCLVCAVSDAVLITLGVAGFAQIVAVAPGLAPFLRYAGAAFLLVYGALSLRNALRSQAALEPTRVGRSSLLAAVGAALAFTWLNPHVYLDTVVLLGSIATQFPGREMAFAVGAVTASFAFFFSLGYGARLLRPLFARPAAWRVLELFVGLVMWAIAAGLILGE